jgi:phosphomannomutase
MLRSLGDAKPRKVRIAYTPLHGLGASFVERALAEAGFEHVAVVAGQRQPHPAFPTVPFPNPEEPAVMNAVFELAEQSGADVALANDPDVDRLAVGIPGQSGKFTPLSGNQVGVLLADFLLQRDRARGGVARPLVVQSVVSTPMLRSIAETYGARCERTLTGFKWISRPAIALGDSVRFVLGFEEAIGYAVSPEVRDKDGISAALVIAQLVNACALDGTTLAAQLFALYQRHGLWVSAQHNITLPGAVGVSRIAAAMNALRAATWSELGGQEVTRVTDYGKGADTRATWLGKSNLMELELGEFGRVLVRPSGTEPKLKVYVDIRGLAPADSHLLHAAEAELELRARGLAAELAKQLGLE